MRRSASTGKRDGATATVRPAAPEPARHSVDALFSGPRPASMRRGLEPAFLLFDRDLLDRLQFAADQLGVHRNTLLQRIARDHLDEY